MFVVGYGYIEISNAISKTEGEVKGSGRRQNPSFIFKAKVLTPKSLYKMRLTCEDTDTGIKSQAEGNITTSSDLSPGMLTLCIAATINSHLASRYSIVI